MGGENARPAYDPPDHVLTRLRALDKQVVGMLEAGIIRIVRVQWLLEHEPKMVGRCQDLRTGPALFKPAEAAALLSSGSRRLFVLSFGWGMVAGHPDPTGTLLANVITFFRYVVAKYELRPEDLGLFWDFASMPQPPRSEADESAFHTALKAMGWLYASAVGTCVVQHKRIPDRPKSFDGKVKVFKLPASATSPATLGRAKEAMLESMPSDLAWPTQITLDELPPRKCCGPALRLTGAELLFATHDEARAFCERMEENKKEGGPFIECKLKYNDLPYDERGWCVMEQAAAAEIEGRLQMRSFEPILNAVRTLALPKMFEISQPSEPKIVSLTEPQPPGYVLSKIRQSKFSFGGDLAVVVQTYRDYHSALFHLIEVAKGGDADGDSQPLYVDPAMARLQHATAVSRTELSLWLLKVLPLGVVQFADYASDILVLATLYRAGTDPEIPDTQLLDDFWAGAGCVTASIVIVWILSLAIIFAMVAMLPADVGFLVRLFQLPCGTKPVGMRQDLFDFNSPQLGRVMMLGLLAPFNLHTVYAGTEVAVMRGRIKAYDVREKRYYYDDVNSMGMYLLFLICKILETGVESVPLAIITASVLGRTTKLPNVTLDGLILLWGSLALSTISMAYGFFTLCHYASTVRASLSYGRVECYADAKRLGGAAFVAFLAILTNVAWTIFAVSACWNATAIEAPTRLLPLALIGFHVIGLTAGVISTWDWDGSCKRALALLPALGVTLAVFGPLSVICAAVDVGMFLAPVYDPRDLSNPKSTAKQLPVRDAINILDSILGAMGVSKERAQQHTDTQLRTALIARSLGGMITRVLPVVRRIFLLLMASLPLIEPTPHRPQLAAAVCLLQLADLAALHWLFGQLGLAGNAEAMPPHDAASGTHRDEFTMLINETADDDADGDHKDGAIAGLADGKAYLATMPSKGVEEGVQLPHSEVGDMLEGVAVHASRRIAKAAYDSAQDVAKAPTFIMSFLPKPAPNPYPAAVVMLSKAVEAASSQARADAAMGALDAADLLAVRRAVEAYDAASPDADVTFLYHLPRQYGSTKVTQEAMDTARETGFAPQIDLTPLLAVPRDDPTRYEHIMRVVPLRTIFERPALLAPTDSSSYNLSTPAERADFYVSHCDIDAAAYSSEKVKLLRNHLCLSALRVRATVMLSILAVFFLPLAFGIHALVPTFRWWLPSATIGCGLVLFLGWLELVQATPRLFSPWTWLPTRVWINRCCVNTETADTTAAAARQTLDFLVFSDRMIAIVSPSYFERLWTMYELASFCKNYEQEREELQEKLTILSTEWGSYAFAGFAGSALSHDERARLRAFRCRTAACDRPRDRALILEGIRRDWKDGEAGFDAFVHKKLPSILEGAKREHSRRLGKLIAESLELVLGS